MDKLFRHLEQVFDSTDDPKVICKYIEEELNATLKYFGLKPRRTMISAVISNDTCKIEGMNFYTCLLLQGLYVENNYYTHDYVAGNGVYYTFRNYTFKKSTTVPTTDVIIAKSLLQKNRTLLSSYKQKVVAILN